MVLPSACKSLRLPVNNALLAMGGSFTSLHISFVRVWTAQRRSSRGDPQVGSVTFSLQYVSNWSGAYKPESEGIFLTQESERIFLTQGMIGLTQTMGVIGWWNNMVTLRTAKQTTQWVWRSHFLCYLNYWSKFQKSWVTSSLIETKIFEDCSIIYLWIIMFQGWDTILGSDQDKYRV